MKGSVRTPTGIERTGGYAVPMRSAEKYVLRRTTVRCRVQEGWEGGWQVVGQSIQESSRSVYEPRYRRCMQQRVIYLSASMENE